LYTALSYRIPSQNEAWPVRKAVRISPVKLSYAVTDDINRDLALDNKAESKNSMAATAKHELRRKFPADATSGDEDIAAIAKQISDHAEAIYQTWKSRGLAPTEILNCHSNATAADKFGTVLTPTSSTNSSVSNNFVSSKKLPSSPVDILTQDNNNLEKLVNNFVVEDKARIAASRQRSPSKNLPSSIQFALQKFEQNSTLLTQSLNQPKTPTQLKQTSFPNRPSQIVKPQVAKSPPGSHHNEIFLETIETSYPAEVVPSKIVVQQKSRPVSTLLTCTHATSPTQTSPIDGSCLTSGLTTWPLKNKIVSDSRKPAGVQILKSPTAKDGPKPMVKVYENSDYMDEVAREEERLINALKTGAVITEDPTEIIIPVVPISKQKPAIVREKPKVDPVKPILISPSQVSALNSSAMVSNAIATQNIISLSNGVKGLSKEDLSSMSVVDYAKIRYRAAQQNPTTQQRLDEQKSNANATFNASEPIVTVARSKFEFDLNKDKTKDKNNDNKDKDKDKDKDKEASKDEKDFIASRWGLRLNSPRPRPVEPVPHPELTTQQKQHIRAAAATSTGNNPVRPFLTRGSVAERVLIFEKCPSELLLDKRGPRQPVINTWRTGQEVHNKAQVSFTKGDFYLITVSS
jgi:serine/threonine-protein phosphatase 2A regulatory subunit B''